MAFARSGAWASISMIGKVVCAALSVRIWVVNANTLGPDGTETADGPEPDPDPAADGTGTAALTPTSWLAFRPARCAMSALIGPSTIRSARMFACVPRVPSIRPLPAVAVDETPAT